MELSQRWEKTSKWHRQTGREGAGAESYRAGWGWAHCRSQINQSARILFYSGYSICEGILKGAPEITWPRIISHTKYRRLRKYPSIQLSKASGGRACVSKEGLENILRMLWGSSSNRGVWLRIGKKRQLQAARGRQPKWSYSPQAKTLDNTNWGGYYQTVASHQCGCPRRKTPHMSSRHKRHLSVVGRFPAGLICLRDRKVHDAG